MPVLVFEEEQRLRYQCACDRCGFTHELAPTAEQASEGFHEQAPGVFYCDICEFLQLEPPNRLDQMIGMLHQQAPHLDLRPGTVARQVVEQLVQAAADQQSTTERFQQMALPLARRVNLGSVARQLFAVEPLPQGALPVYETQKLTVASLPAWCREGQLLRRLADGDVVRVRAVDGFQVTYVVGAYVVDSFTRLNPDAPFETVFEPITPKSRWEHLLEED